MGSARGRRHINGIFTHGEANLHGLMTYLHGLRANVHGFRPNVHDSGTNL
ncbi:hypothetical protein [Bifidobacterium stellenboschense]|nr:hypothetical protein [Bifidobacterium stellenboschense]